MSKTQKEAAQMPPGATGEHATSSRIDRTCRGDAELRALLDRMLDISARGLARMFDNEQSRFVFRVRRLQDGSIIQEGESLRYGAIVLLGARWLSESQQRAIFGGETALEFCSRTIELSKTSEDLGAASLCAWAAFELGHPKASAALLRALELETRTASPYTVELAWLGSALAASSEFDAEATARRIANRLLEGFGRHAHVFPRQVGEPTRGLRSHVACFADQVYPIQALSRIHRRFGADRALDAASACATRISGVQGEGGQWWWHYDRRTGDVVEGYPVYSVHQDGMAPMCLLDLEEAGGPSFRTAIARGLRWMAEAPEVGRSLIDDEELVIWRKVMRRGPNKVMRVANAAASKVHQDLRVDFLSTAFPPRSVDWESRPYHLGWVLHAWLNES